MSDVVIGIDLGTTNSVVACVVDGKATILRGPGDVADTVPSCVGLDASGKVIVGASARNQFVAAPERTIASIKRRMGSDEQVALGDQSYTPTEISAFILKALKERAESALGHAVTKAVITVPAYFTDAQRQATRDAGAIAGLEVLRIINEPTAAALGYGGHQQKRAKVLVYDLGGGTFDVSVVSIESGVVEVLASTGDNHLGGDDFDQIIREKLIEHLGAAGQELRDSPQAMARLLRSSEDAKIRLSKVPYSQIVEDHLGTVDGNPVHLDYELARQAFAEAVEPHLERTMEAVSRALVDAQVRPSELDKILLVGGSSRIPRVRELLRERLGQEPHDEVDPDLCVALGAAVQAGIEMGVDLDTVLVDVTPYTFGMSCIGSLYGQPYAHQFVPLIRRNTKLPVEHSEVFFKTRPGQDEILIQVYQGEDPDALKNQRIGEFSFRDLDDSDAAHERGIVITLSLNSDGILQLRAVERHSKKSLQCHIDNVMAVGDKGVARAQDKLAKVWEDSSNDVLSIGAPLGHDAEAHGVTPLILPPEVHSVVQRAQEALNDAPEDSKVDLITLIETVHSSYSAGEGDAVVKAKEEIEEILFYLE